MHRLRTPMSRHLIVSIRKQVKLRYRNGKIAYTRVGTSPNVSLLDRLKTSSDFLSEQVHLLDTLIEIDPRKIQFIDDLIDSSFPGDSLELINAQAQDIFDTLEVTFKSLGHPEVCSDIQTPYKVLEKEEAQESESE